MRSPHFLALLWVFCTQVRAERMSWLENDRIRLGVDLDRGGAITFLAAAKDGANVINNFDLGRQVQLSFFSGPVPFEADGQKPAEHWKHIGWNPIQSGDDFKNTSRILAHKNNGSQIHVSCVPMQWPLNNVPGECSFDSWLELDGNVVKARARLTNQRSDHAQYPARLQELPAVYANAPFHRVVSYQGSRPFTDDGVADAPRPQSGHPWSFWMGTEGWAALLDGRDYGLGLITPGRVHFTGGFAGQPGPNDTHGNSTGYLAGQGQDILDHNIAYEFRYELVLGTLKEIRARAATWRPQALPTWSFAQDRQGWHYLNTSDTGWPVKDHLHVLLEKEDPQLVSPFTFWLAEEASHLVIDAAFQTQQRQATLMWQAHGTSGFSSQRLVSFPIVADGTFHRHVVHLGGHAGYRGGMIRLRLDPVGQVESGAWMKLRSVKLTTSSGE